eukprot:CAMPEP_0202862594 /NCGR_PEP_ID=MMETSP1391-20130828/3578_1 /ASSEMBLY_ACC=CAM_ASM_000867 /TAXON_ID=1034604 /ORGANISM="Chlamydomonas leiostraca, Strain SAG 11-49" /LENGTH=386 /DNA_ID=CAMNT_0049542143 /DNA_START=60 /DNA_END=1220 /DNA_ORIENTATION=-
MFADGYVGSAEDSARIRRQQKEREKERKKFEELAKAKHDEAAQAGLKQFASTTSEALEHAFKNETIGLVTKAEFIKKRTTLQERMEEEVKRKLQAEEEAAAAERERKRKEKQGAGTKKLSFAVDDEEEADGADEPAPAPVFRLPGFGGSASNGAGDSTAGASGRGGGEEPSTSGGAGDKGPDAKRARTDGPGAVMVKKKLGKDPTVVTDFLPDRDRAAKEEELRAELRREWQAAQDRVKAEPLHIVYSYWDGSGHRREITIKKGDTVGGFLKAVREQLSKEFRELRHVSVDNLLYIKEDIILPQHYSFYDLIINKARGKSGPLFDFGVHEDLRVVNDASREKMESHAGKVVERHWYDRNKHIFPASRWEIYDPDKKYETYTIYGEH